MPNDPDARNGRGAFKAERIPSARFFDLDKVCDTSSPFPHMLPDAALFAKEMGKLGIHPDDEVVVYDTKELGIFSAPRVAWTLRVFGHRSVYILNNFRLWVEEGLPTESGDSATPEPVEYPVPAERDDASVIGFSELRETVLDQNKEGATPIQILDVWEQPETTKLSTEFGVWLG